MIYNDLGQLTKPNSDETIFNPIENEVLYCVIIIIINKWKLHFKQAKKRVSKNHKKMSTPIFKFQHPDYKHDLYIIHNTYSELPETVPMDLTTFVIYHIKTGRTFSGLLIYTP